MRHKNGGNVDNVTMTMGRRGLGSACEIKRVACEPEKENPAPEKTGAGLEVPPGKRRYFVFSVPPPRSAS